MNKFFIKAWGFAGETPTSLLPDNSTSLVAIGRESNEIKVKLEQIREQQGLEPVVVWKYTGYVGDIGMIPIYVVATGHFKSLTINEIFVLDEAGPHQARQEAYRQMHHYVTGVLGYRVILK
ncbi:MAG: hypothetical protein GC165_04785 [Armatimonadetes bacterium]|nr:hypothetical protein [Armatimonadota bacterium]MBS1727671.1 hypothetical protein [Armatimonadota bacterium]